MAALFDGDHHLAELLDIIDRAAGLAGTGAPDDLDSIHWRGEDPYLDAKREEKYIGMRRFGWTP